MSSKPAVNDLVSRAVAFEKAMVYVKKEGVSLARAGAAHGVSKTSLHRRCTGTVPVDARKGRRALLTPDDEAGIVETILLRARHGVCMTDSELRILARRIAIRKHGVLPDTFPSKKWSLRFVTRHGSLISRKRSQILDVKRYDMSTTDRIKDYHENLQKAMKGMQPGQIWNCDETGFCPQGRKPPRVICPKGMRANLVRSNERENVSVMACVSAAGDRLPPMFIFPGKRRQLHWMNGTDDDAVCAMTDSSNINGYLFLHWLKFFNEHLMQRQVSKPALLILDGHFSHVNGPVLDYADENDIMIFVLPSHTSHFTQPLDDAVFAALKRNYEKLLNDFPLRRDRSPTKEDVAGLVTAAWKQSVSVLNCLIAFRRTGIFPLCLETMLKRVIGSQPATSDLPHVSYLSRLPQLSDRQKRKLARDGMTEDAVTALYMGIEQFKSIAPSTQHQQKKKRTFVDGGILMTHPEMKAAVLRAEAERKQKAEDRVTKARERLEKREQKQQAAIIKHFLKETKLAAKNKLSVEAKKRRTCRKTVVKTTFPNGTVPTSSGTRADSAVCTATDDSQENDKVAFTLLLGSDTSRDQVAANSALSGHQDSPSRPQLTTWSTDLTAAV